MDLVDRFRAQRQPLSSVDDGTRAINLKQYFTKKSSEDGGSQMGRRISDDTESTTHFAKDTEGLQGE